MPCQHGPHALCGPSTILAMSLHLLRAAYGSWHNGTVPCRSIQTLNTLESNKCCEIQEMACEDLLEREQQVQSSAQLSSLL